MTTSRVGGSAYPGYSPHSSSVGNSNNGTPDTRITAFTPEDHGNRSGVTKKPRMSSQESLCSNFGITGFTSTDKDPFVTNDTPKGEQKLSPTASTFQPFCLQFQGLNRGPVVVSSSGSGNNLSGPRLPVSGPGPVSPLESSASDRSTSQMGTFSTDTSITRALKISGIYGPVSISQVETCMQEASTSPGGRRLFGSGNDALVRFNNILESQQVYTRIRMTRPDWSVDYITPTELSKRVESNPSFISAHEGQIYLIANYPGNISRGKLETICLDLLSVDGVVFAYQKQMASEAGAFKLIAEFADTHSATQAIDRLNGQTIRDINLTLGYHRPDTEKPHSGRYGIPITPTRSSDGHELSRALGRLTMTPSATASPQPYQNLNSMLSPTGRSIMGTSYRATDSPFGDSTDYRSQMPLYSAGSYGLTPPATLMGSTPQGNPFGASAHSSSLSNYWQGMNTPSRDARSNLFNLGRIITPGHRQNAMRVVTRSPHSNSVGQHHNTVNVARIQEGSDVRTTIMLRNIPNKIDQKMLKKIIDETSFGLYDFMYLRIDFANNCNVGYAFINFEDPYHIINFIRARSGQRWSASQFSRGDLSDEDRKMFNSDKIAEVSYATIQGKDCLVQKFRNSSVMLETEHYRPKIFFTLGHPNAGEEEDFPDPDNNSKMRRSVENAEHVGLFAPRAGQHYRDEQRRRRSQYDRGTRLAALEEFDFDEVVGLSPFDEPRYDSGQYNGEQVY